MVIGFGNLGKKQKIFFGLFATVLSATLFLFIFIIGTALSLFREVKNLPESARPLKDALLLYDLDKLTAELDRFRAKVQALNSQVSALTRFSFVPGEIGRASCRERV